LKDPEHRQTLDYPERYPFADISQNNHNNGQKHWNNLQWVRRYTDQHPRPLNNVKIYGADTGSYGSRRDGVERFWRNIFGGAASARFHRPDSGLGLTATAQAHLKSARMLSKAIDLIEAEPDADSSRLSSREANEAYLCSIPGRAHAVYFPDGGAVEVKLKDAKRWQVRWLRPAQHAWQEQTNLAPNGRTQLETPSDGHWIALLTADGSN
jgi:hypothetical protein